MAAGPASAELSRAGVAKIKDGQRGVTEATRFVLALVSEGQG